MLIQLIPGDPALTILGNHATPAKVALLHKEWGLDKPLPAQYLKFLGRLLHGDLGKGLGGHVRSLFLPALTVALAFTPILIRSLRNALIEVLQSDYIATARSKGLSERRVLWRHALRNAIISTTAVLAVNLAYL